MTEEDKQGRLAWYGRNHYHYCNRVIDPSTCCPIVPCHGDLPQTKRNCQCWPRPLAELYFAFQLTATEDLKDWLWDVNMRVNNWPLKSEGGKQIEKNQQ